ncbi:hypothetical protein FQR65_LT03456 [Abscondita terminalis]|nr:hypothetical protein FQR65_LT03456 [Abscondita terminalis]
MTKSREFHSRDKSECVFDHASHPSSILAGFQSLRERKLLFDITLIVGRKHFKAHKAVLAACSDYFRAMFTEPMLESRQNEVTLNGLTAKGFKIVLDYMYTARLVLDQSNVQDVLSAANHIQIQLVVYACCTYLQNQIEIENCVDIANIAENYCLSHLKNRTYMFMSAHLIEFSNSHEFYRLSMHQLKTLLTCDYPVNCSEGDILQIVLNWFLNVESPEKQLRIKNVSQVLEEIHFSEIPRWKLNSILDDILQNHDEFELHKLIVSEYQCQRNLKNLNICSNEFLLNSRGMELAILKIGGFGIKGMTNEITYCMANKSKWRHLTSIPHVEQCNFGASVYANELYVIGGCFNQSLQETIHPFGFKYNPWFNKWSTIAPMKTERCRFSLTLVGRYFYAVGGSVETEGLEDGNEVTTACERYDPSTDTWESIQPLPEYRTQHAAAAYESKQNKWLFISGGMDKDTVLSSLCYYNTTFDTWWPCQPMLTPRADHVMISMCHKIYVCGGWTEDSETRTRVLVDTIDVYDVVNNLWSVVTRVPTPRYHAGIVGLNGKIYFIGGFHNDATFDRDTAAIECYDTVTNLWSTEEKYPQVIWEHNCATLYVPKCRDDMEVIRI